MEPSTDDLKSTSEASDVPKLSSTQESIQPNNNSNTPTNLPEGPSPDRVEDQNHQHPADLDPSSSSSISIDQELVELKKTLGNVGASLGGWWGKVQKQSAEVISSSKITAQLDHAVKDLASLNLIEKAKKEVEKLSDQAREGYAAVSSELEKGPDLQSRNRIVNVDGLEIGPMVINNDNTQSELPSTATSPKGKERALDQNDGSSPDQPSSFGSPLLAFDKNTFSSFFSKLSKDSEKITASLQSTLSQLPSAAHPSRLAEVSSKFDLSEVSKLAEGYLARGEVYLQDVGKELREIVQDAVKVIPPSDDQPELPNNITSLTEANSLKQSQGKREGAIFKLRTDETQILQDPKEDDHLAASYEEYVKSVEAQIGTDEWKNRIQTELGLLSDEDQPHGSILGLRAMHDKLVPQTLSPEVFWTRYFFRANQIEHEEAARRVVLNAAQEDNEGDFSWDMEDESEPNSPVLIKSTEAASKPVEPGSRSETPTNSASPNEPKASSPSESTPRVETCPTIPNNTASGRNSSDGTIDSFDVVSSHQSADERNEQVKMNASHQDDDEDSDWE